MGNETELCRPGERVDDLQCSGLRILQDPKRFCFGMDAVLLAGFAAAGENPSAPGTKAGSGRRKAAVCRQLLDLGTGTGIIPLLLSAKTAAEHLTGLEIQSESADMARRSVEMNGLSGRISIMCGDIRDTDRIFPAASFDVVTCNPPYMTKGHGLANPEGPLAIARHELLCTFSDVASAAQTLLVPGGRFYLVHRPFRLAEIMVTLHEKGLEPKRMKMVHPFIDRAPSMVLLECVRGGRVRLEVEKPLVVYAGQGRYTQEIYDIYGY
jgi:tRNA1Val (adenine37-N6)-methyltransferase